VNGKIFILLREMAKRRGKATLPQHWGLAMDKGGVTVSMATHVGGESL
jgi:hypothetical protein